ncbi:hypothetical protein FRC98_07290 [Lujinxingia vulgaris]|uniref:DNA alkylation repair protein n=1 Tax=Lujinxingia vulgaris TaxID=2600176 RepID=A0A5C6XIS6_9DELT|nr:hypothetical protein [Lujinxingia vulgaris]TXD37489.1 hypothetical protein FRC98_07290 [Lujinxingia vulgaris]
MVAGTQSETTRTPYKLWFDAALVDELATLLRAAHEDFDRALFRREATHGLDTLEFKDRTLHIADAMALAMPWPTAERMQTLIAALPPMLPEADGSVEKGYRFWPFGEFIARQGLDDFDASFEAMTELTMRFTSEFAIRPFLQTKLDESLERLESLLNHPNQHVRRWISEGTRTRLPWASGVRGLKGAQSRRLKLLEALRFDPERYVQRSVANHLQDIVKDDLPTGLDTLERWAADGESNPSEGDLLWVVRHAARGQLKAGHPRVLRIFGFEPGLATIGDFALSHDELKAGDTLTLSVTLHNPTARPLALRVDYALSGPTKSGRTFSKVFRWSDLELGPGQSKTLQTTHSFAHRSTRKVYTGLHRLEAHINGEPSRACEIWLEGLEGNDPNALKNLT